ncbi:MAG: T9SS type A sorting domain-containing protein [Flavobacteriales bacterium]|nr:T9SS type A sorting domain-containing protein [Flavobacteriales bacterium]
MKKFYSKSTALVFFMAGVLSQNVSAQCAVTTGPTNDCSYGDAIDNFSIGTTTSSNTGCSNSSGYSAYSTPVFNFDLDVPYALSANVGGATYDQGLAIWIDLNNDGVYDASEQVYASSTAALSHTGTITIASTFPGVVIGTPLPMRVMCAYSTVLTGSDACTSSIGSYGETEDYVAVISGVLPSNVEATAVFEPFDLDCGDVSDSVKVTVTNLTANDEINVPVELNLSGLVTGTYYDTIPSLLGNASMDLNMAVINTQVGGTLNAELIVSLVGDGDTSDDTLAVTIDILDATDLVITGDSVVCEGDSLDLSISNPSGAEVYDWYIDGVTATSGTNINTGALIASSQITVESSNGCRANDTLDVTVNLVPVLSFTSSVNGGTVDFTGTVANEDSVSWDFGDGSTGSGTNVQHTYTSNGGYFVCFTAYSSCGSVDYCDSVMVSTIGVDELFLGGTVEVYPNPTADEVNINFDASDAFTGKWELYDIDGKVLQSKTVDGVSSLSISLGQYPVGTYILKMTSDSGEAFRKELMKN